MSNISHKFFTRPRVSLESLGNSVDFIIIGGGLWGSAVKKYFENRGENCVVIDSGNPLGASKCALGTFKDSWIPKEDYGEIVEGLEMVDDVISPIQEVSFSEIMKDDSIRSNAMLWCNPLKFLDCPILEGKVKKVKGKKVWVNCEEYPEGDALTLEAKRGVIVCAGAFTNQLLQISGYPVDLLDSYWGANYDLSISGLQDINRMKKWKPYGYSTLVKFPNFQRFSDGCTVKNPKVNDPRIEKVSVRLSKHLGDILFSNVDPDLIQVLNEGLRPAKRDPSEPLFVVHDEFLTSATGGRRNGLVLSGKIAKRAWKYYFGE